MANLDESSDSSEAGRLDELTTALARLSDGKRQQYETQVSNAAERYGDVSHEFKLGVAKTFAQGLPPRHESEQIDKYDRQERYRASDRDHRAARGRPDNGKQPQQDDLAQAKQPQPKEQGRADTMKGVSPHAPSYADLKRTHEKVAASTLSVEQLKGIAELCAKFREDKKLDPTISDRREGDTLVRMQAEERQRLVEAHGANPTHDQKRQVEMLDHQQLAERVGGEARSIGRELRRQGLPGAEPFEQGSRRAYEAARLVHLQRQQIGRGPEQGKELARVSREQQDQQRKSEAQEAKHGNRALTSEQRANASPEAKQSLDRQERAEAARKLDLGAGFRAVQREATKPGNVRSSGGRGR
jgi:hypothetical protein